VADLFLRSLLEKFPHPSSQKVMGDLPQEIAMRFSLLPDHVGVDPENFLVTPSRILSSLHPSWYEELVEAVPEGMRPVVNRSLEEYRQGEESPLREFILGYLVNSWSEKDIPCLETMERGDFSWLLECNPEEIETIASLVGTYDLVEEVRKTIDKKSLEKLFSSLSLMQRRYLRALLHTPLPGLKSTINLPEFLRLPTEEGKERLLARGYERLATALQGQDEIFIWYLLHRLERSQAHSLERRLKEGRVEESSRSKTYITHAYQFLKRRESK